MEGLRNCAASVSPKLLSLGSARRAVALAAAATLIGTGVSLGATSYTYVGSSTGDVNVSTNWTPNGIPSGSANDIVKLNVYLTDVSARADFGAARREVFADPFPCSTLVGRSISRASISRNPAAS